MFKRLREGLFGRTETDLDQEEIEQPSPALEEIAQEDEQAEQAAPSNTMAPAAPAVDRVVTPPAPAAQPAPTQEVAARVEARAESPVAEPEAEEQFEEEPEAGDERRGGFFRNPFRFSLGRTRALFGQMSATLEDAEEITDDLWDELEETLITSDVGVQTTDKLMATLRERVQVESMTRGSAVARRAERRA